MNCTYVLYFVSFAAWTLKEIAFMMGHEEFQISSRIIETREYLEKCPFITANIGCKHITAEKVIADHTTAFASEFCGTSADGMKRPVYILDGI